MTRGEPRTSQSRVFTSMATDVTIRIDGLDNAATEPADLAFDVAEEIFASVERECTRFDSSSPLMRANESADRLYEVPEFCFAAIDEARKQVEDEI